MNDRVAAYGGLVGSLAERLANSPRAKLVGAEYDDLYQEGLINVWQTLQREVTPSAEIIEARMRDWIRHLGAQTGIGRDEDVVYDALLPLDDFRVDQAAA